MAEYINIAMLVRNKLLWLMDELVTVRNGVDMMLWSIDVDLVLASVGMISISSAIKLKIFFKNNCNKKKSLLFRSQKILL